MPAFRRTEEAGAAFDLRRRPKGRSWRAAGGPRLARAALTSLRFHEIGFTLSFADAAVISVHAMDRIWKVKPQATLLPLLFFINPERPWQRSRLNECIDNISQ